MCTRGLPVILAIVASGGLLPSSAAADPITINVLNTSFTTTVRANYHQSAIDPAGTPFIVTERTTTSTNPIQDALVIGPRFFSNASADVFGVSVATTAFPDFVTNLNGSGLALAEAISAIDFTVATDTTGSLQASFFRDLNVTFTGGSAALTDLTLNTILFNNFWTRLGGGNVPFAGFTGLATVDESVTLSATHVYQLLLSAQSDANTDSEIASVTIGGVVPTPEPPAVALAIIGILILGVHRRRRHQHSSLWRGRT